MQDAHGAWGTCHIGIGTSASPGGQTRAAVHYDVMLRDPIVETDGEAIARAGEVLVKINQVARFL